MQKNVSIYMKKKLHGEKIMQFDDASLVKQTLGGNKQAFDRLVEKYYTSIYKLILSWVNSHEDSQELTQETFIDAYTKLISLHEPEKFYYWLRQIAINRCHNWKRNNDIIQIPLVESVTSVEPSPEEAIILKETLVRIMNAIDRLPEPDKSLMKERYLEDTPYRDLQKKYGIPMRALVVRLFRAKQRIKGWVKDLFSVFPWLRFIKVGVIESMKISLTKKIVIIGLSTLLVLGGITGTIWYRYKSMKGSETMVNQLSGQTSLDKASDVIDVVSKKGSDVQRAQSLVKTTSTEKRMTGEEMRETIEWLDSLNSKTGYLPTSNEKLSPEMKKKAELFAELAKILPEFKIMWYKPLEIHSQALHTTDEGELNRIYNEASKAEERKQELLSRLISLCDPILKPPAIEKDERGVVQIINVADICIQLAEYFGKKLPFDGNPDYLAAEDYSGSTGWEDM